MKKTLQKTLSIAFLVIMSNVSAQNLEGHIWTLQDSELNEFKLLGFCNDTLYYFESYPTRKELIQNHIIYRLNQDTLELYDTVKTKAFFILKWLNHEEVILRPFIGNELLLAQQNSIKNRKKFVNFNPSLSNLLPRNKCYSCDGTGICSFCKNKENSQFKIIVIKDCSFCHKNRKCIFCKGTGHD